MHRRSYGNGSLARGEPLAHCGYRAGIRTVFIMNRAAAADRWKRERRRSDPDAAGRIAGGQQGSVSC